MVHLSIFIVMGNHQWHGVSPSFVVRLMRNRVVIRLFVRLISWRNMWVELDIIRIIEAAAWIRKYFVVASVSWFWEDMVIIGMKDRRFSSSPIHIKSQFLDDKEMEVPKMSVAVKRKKWGMEESIKDERS